MLAGWLVVALAGCHRPKHYETDVEVTRSSIVRADEAGRPLTLDLEVSFTECPGAQPGVVRGGAEFAACVGKYEVGDKLRVGIEHERIDEAHYKWTVRKIGDCARTPDPNDEASYAVVRECDARTVNVAKVGFECRTNPEKALVERCPWFRRR